MRKRAWNAIPAHRFIERRALLSLLKSTTAALLGAGLGLFATWSALERGIGFDAVQAGPWRSAPKSAFAAADPYTRAALARNGQVPLSPGEGLVFTAAADETGAPLLTRCDYILTSPIPAARFWTLTPMTGKGALAPTGNDRTGLTSAEIVRDSAGRFEIMASVHARPGNWLALPPGPDFMLALRLYDTPASSLASAMSAGQLPRLRRGRCA